MIKSDLISDMGYEVYKIEKLAGWYLKDSDKRKEILNKLNELKTIIESIESFELHG